MTHPKLTQSRLKELLHYDPDTGVFKWLKPTCTRMHAGDVAGSIHPNGYRRVRIDGKDYNTSWLAFLYMEGYIPEHEVDHRNRIRDDDRWQNLRHVSRQCNMRNRGMFKNNSSGITGVSWHKLTSKWQARIRVNKNLLYLGVFDTKEHAAKSRWEAEKKYGFPGCNSSSSAYLYLLENDIL